MSFPWRAGRSQLPQAIHNFRRPFATFTSRSQLSQAVHELEEAFTQRAGRSHGAEAFQTDCKSCASGAFFARFFLMNRRSRRRVLVISAHLRYPIIPVSVEQALWSAPALPVFRSPIFMHCRPCLRCFVARVPVLLALAFVTGPLHSVSARPRTQTPAISNPAPFGSSNTNPNPLSLGDAPIGGPVVKLKVNAAQQPSPGEWTGAAPPPGVPDVPGVTYSNASDSQNADPSQPPPALGPAPVPLDSIRALQVGNQRLSDAPLRVATSIFWRLWSTKYRSWARPSRAPT